MKPFGVDIESIKPTTIDLYWLPSSDNASVAGYRIYNADTGLEVGQTAGTSYGLSGLISGTTYSYFVKAYDPSGNYSPAGGTVKITPGAGPNTLAGSGLAEFTVNPEPMIGVTFSDVTSDGLTTVTSALTPVADPPPGFRFRGNQLDISTSAGYTAPITIAVKYDPADLLGDEAALKLFHFESGQWRDVTLYVDTANNVIVARTNSLSPFILGEPETPATGNNTVMLLALALAMMLGGAGVVYGGYSQRQVGLKKL